MTTPKYKITVLGIGNSLLGDDSLGPKVIKKLKQEDWGTEILILNCGTCPLNYLKQLKYSQYVIVIDVIYGDKSAGAIYQFDLADLKQQTHSNTNAHSYTLPQVINLAREITSLPEEVIYYGIEPINLDFSTELSNPVHKSINQLINQIKEKINYLTKN